MNDYDNAKQFIKMKKYDQAIILLRKIYQSNPNNLIVKFQLAKLLIKNYKTKEEGKELLEEMLYTDNRDYAMLELRRLEESVGNTEKARFKTLQRNLINI